MTAMNSSDGAMRPAELAQPGQDDPSEPERSTPGRPAETHGGESGPSLIGRITSWAFGNGGENIETGGETSEEQPILAGASPAERAMLLNIVKMRDLRVLDVMTPRADITAVSVDDGLDSVIDAFRTDSLSRLPVYRETLDDPIGFVHLKDIALTYGFGCETTEAFKLSEHIRTALFVPASMRAAVLLQQMQLKRVHMALVIDEFGGVDGLVTIEDLVEQIVGDIEDEHDEADLAEWIEESPGVFNVSARAEIIEDVEEAIGHRLRPDDWEEEADTIGGLVFMIANRVPARGEVIMHPDGHEFEVTDADPRRINRIRMILDGAESLATQAAAE